MVGNKKDYSWLWPFLILFSAFLNIAVHSAVLIPESKVQLLKEAESEIQGKSEERTFRSPGLWNRSRRRQKRVKRYDRNSYQNWKPGDPDPFADIHAERERKYDAYEESRRREKEDNRRHNEERARLNAFVLHFVFLFLKVK